MQFHLNYIGKSEAFHGLLCSHKRGALNEANHLYICFAIWMCNTGPNKKDS